MSQPCSSSQPLSIITVTWNASGTLTSVLSLSIRKLRFPNEVIIVDNASSDGTPELIAKEFPRFKLVRKSENLGFAKANNIGIGDSTWEEPMLAEFRRCALFRVSWHPVQIHGITS